MIFPMPVTQSGAYTEMPLRQAGLIMPLFPSSGL